MSLPQMSIHSTILINRLKKHINPNHRNIMERKNQINKRHQNEDILQMIPQKAPFLFVEDILQLDETGIIGTYRFKVDEFFYEGHFPNNPITPGVILTEAMAQIGLLAFGIYLCGLDAANKNEDSSKLQVFLTSSNIRFRKAIYPGEKVIVESTKIYFKSNVLKCHVTLKNAANEIACDGVLSGMFIL